MGSIYKRGNVYWVKFYANGRSIRESSRSTKQADARQLLKEREGRVVTGQPILRRADRVLYDEVAQDLRLHYQVTGARNVKEAEYRLKHLARFFSGRHVSTIGPADVTTYVAGRQAKGAARGTIRCELATLSRVLRLAYEVTVHVVIFL